MKYIWSQRQGNRQ